MSQTTPSAGVRRRDDGSIARRTRLRGEALAVIVASIVLALAGTWPLAAHLRTHLPADVGDPVLTAWTLAWDASRFAHGLGRLWDAPNFFPYRHTLAYSDHLLAIAVFTAPIQWLSANPVFAYNVAFIASFAFSACGMYVLARSTTGRIDAAAIAAAAYAFAPFRAAHLSHLQWLTLGWLPLSVWALVRYFRTGRTAFALASALFFYLQAMTASYFVYFGLLPLACVAAPEWHSTKIPSTRAIRDLAIAAALVAAAFAPIAAVYYSVRQDLGLRRSISDIAAFSADLSSYVRASHDLRFWRLLPAGGPDRETFPGIIAPALAISSVVWWWRRSTIVRALAIAGVLAILLSLGPAPAAWGHVLPFPGPYRLLLAIVPGLDGLRAPGRLAVVVILAVSALAAFGAAGLIDRTPAPARRFVALALGVLVMAEGWIAPIRLAAFDPAGEPRDREVYEYVRSAPRGGVLELPTSLGEPLREFRYEYMTLVHGHPVVNGHSGYISPLAEYLAGGHSPLRELNHIDAMLAALGALDVRFLIVHRIEAGGDELADAVSRAVGAHPSLATTMRDFGSATVVTVPYSPLPAPPAGIRVVPTAAIDATASSANDRLAQAFDGDPDSRWLSGYPQSGNEWVQLAFDRPRDVGMVRLTLAERSFGDYPRGLAIDVSEDNGTRTLFDGPALPQFLAGLIANPHFPAIDIVLPPNRARAIRLRQTGATNQFFWSIHELQVWER